MVDCISLLSLQQLTVLEMAVCIRLLWLQCNSWHSCRLIRLLWLQCNSWHSCRLHQVTLTAVQQLTLDKWQSASGYFDCSATADSFTKWKTAPSYPKVLPCGITITTFGLSTIVHHPKNMTTLTSSVLFANSKIWPRVTEERRQLLAFWPPGIFSQYLWTWTKFQLHISFIHSDFY